MKMHFLFDSKPLFNQCDILLAVFTQLYQSLNTTNFAYIWKIWFPDWHYDHYKRKYIFTL